MNGATKVLHLPALPKFEIKGDYWKDKKEAVEEGLSTVVGLTYNGPGIVGKVAGVLSNAGQAVELITDKDARTGKPLTDWEAAKDAAGVVKGIGTSGSGANRAVGTAEKIVKKAAESLKK